MTVVYGEEDIMTYDFMVLADTFDETMEVEPGCGSPLAITVYYQILNSFDSARKGYTLDVWVSDFVSERVPHGGKATPYPGI